MDGASALFAQYGQLGLWVVAALALFRFLLTRGDMLSKRNVAELQRQLEEWSRRALRAELINRAYLRAGIMIPQDELEIEVALQQRLSRRSLFPEWSEPPED